MKAKLITAFLIIAVLAVGVCAVGFVRDKRIHNLNVFKPKLYGTVTAVDGTEITVEASVWGEHYERIELSGKTVTFDCQSVTYPDGNFFQDGIAVGEDVYLVVDGYPYDGEELVFDRIYFCVEYLK